MLICGATGYFDTWLLVTLSQPSVLIPKAVQRGYARHLNVLVCKLTSSTCSCKSVLELGVGTSTSYYSIQNIPKSSSHYFVDLTYYYEYECYPALLQPELVLLQSATTSLHALSDAHMQTCPSMHVATCIYIYVYYIMSWWNSVPIVLEFFVILIIIYYSGTMCSRLVDCCRT